MRRSTAAESAGVGRNQGATAAAILNRVGLGREMGERERERARGSVGRSDPSQALVLVWFNHEPGAKSSFYFHRNFIKKKNYEKKIYSVQLEKQGRKINKKYSE